MRKADARQSESNSLGEHRGIHLQEPATKQGCGLDQAIGGEKAISNSGPTLIARAVLLDAHRARDLQHHPPWTLLDAPQPPAVA